MLTAFLGYIDPINIIWHQRFVFDVLIDNETYFDAYSVEITIYKKYDLDV